LLSFERAKRRIIEQLRQWRDSMKRHSLEDSVAFGDKFRVVGYADDYYYSINILLKGAKVY
jgi:hypothetical protein